MARPAIFLDRDGVINANRSDYVKTWDEFQFLPGALEALRRLAQLGWLAIVVSNQSAIGRGLVAQETVEQIHRQMLEAVSRAGGIIHHVLYCPHHPADNCDCRKPRPGLLLRASKHLQVDLSRSILIGDALSDVEAARAAGCQPILVRTGRGLEQLSLAPAEVQRTLVVVNDLADAVDRVLSLQRK